MAVSIRETMACVMGDINMVRALGLGGIQCAVVTDPGDPSLQSRYTKESLHWYDFETHQDDLVDMLVRYAVSRDERPVLYYQQDAQLLMVSRNRKRLSEHFRFILPRESLIEDLVDKGRFRQLALIHGLPVPRTRHLLFSSDTACSTPETIDMQYPIVIKPLTRFIAWSNVAGEGKALMVESGEAMERLWPVLVAGGMDLLAQEMIPGPESLIESWHCFIDDRGRVLAEFTGRKIRTWPEALGHSTALEITHAPDVATLGRELAGRLSLIGVAKFDFKRGPDGRLWLLEVNPRFSLWHHVGAVAGVNIPAIMHRWLLGQQTPEKSSARAGATWCNITRDRVAAKASGMSSPDWLAWVMKCDAKGPSLSDPRPFLHTNISRIMPSLGRVIDRKVPVAG